MAIRQYEDQNKCSLLSLYGTRDLVTDLAPVCRRAVMQNTMPILRRTPVDTEAVEVIICFICHFQKQVRRLDRGILTKREL